MQDIEGLAVKNSEFRRVLYTAKHCQLVIMALKPKEEIGAEVHKLDQFFRVEEGAGEAVLDGLRTAIRAGFAVVVPAGTNHNHSRRCGANRSQRLNPPETSPFPAFTSGCSDLTTAISAAIRPYSHRVALAELLKPAGAAKRTIVQVARHMA